MKDNISRIVDELIGFSNQAGGWSDTKPDRYLPSLEELDRGLSLLRRIFFPGYFESPAAGQLKSRFAIGALIETVHSILCEQLHHCIQYNCQFKSPSHLCRQEAESRVDDFLACLPLIKEALHLDAQAAYDGDPSAKSIGEVIFCYPSIRALINYRVAHELDKLKVPIIPRILTEMAHSETGIDIHPAAQIGQAFFMDHGTGIVIGETAVIGNRVRLYQGVTLGARSFSKSRDGSLVKGRVRHPIIGDDVIIYSGATILGRIRIGNGAVIGGNLWVSEDVPKGARLVQSRPGNCAF